MRILWNKQGMQLPKNGTLIVSRRYLIEKEDTGAGLLRLPCLAHSFRPISLYFPITYLVSVQAHKGVVRRDFVSFSISPVKSQ